MPPDVFTGDQATATKFLRQFEMYRTINEDVSIMQEPTKRVITFLSYIRGPLVDDWVATMVERREAALAGGTTRTKEKLWKDMVKTFKEAFASATEQQDTQYQLLNLRMHGWELDCYAAEFENLVNRAKYSLTDRATIELFIRGLVPALAQKVMENPTLKPHEMTFDEWKTAATDQQRRSQYIRNHSPQTQFTGQKKGGRSYNDWRRAFGLPAQQGQKVHTPPQHQQHPDAMDVDLVRVAVANGNPRMGHVQHQQYTNDEKKKLIAEGRCFCCQGQGHLSRECPSKDTQARTTTTSKDEEKGQENARTLNDAQGIKAQVRTLSLEQHEELLADLFADQDFA
jgi:hypothetical protein